jgi:hypothetical protein
MTYQIMNYKEILSEDFLNLDKIAQQNQSNYKSEIHISDQKLGTMFKNRKGLKNDVSLNHNKFRFFLMKFRFYKFLRGIREKYFK